jgi:hypothetical protein
VNELGYFIRISTGKADRGTTDDAGWDEMGLAPQHPKSHGYGSAADLGRKTSCTHAATTVFTRPYTLWLLALPGLTMGLQGQYFTAFKVIATAGLPACHTKGDFPWVLPNMPNHCSECVCECACVHMHTGHTSRTIRLKRTMP